MTIPWDSTKPPDLPRVSPLGWCVFSLRALALIPLVFGGLILLLAVRLIERPLCGLNRPVTPHITQTVCTLSLVVMGLRLTVRGAPMQHRGAVVANHSSWLDIFVLNAAQRVYFVSKSEVAGWPGIGWLARATGTVFIERNPRRAREQTETFRNRLLAGHRLLFFPEGTSTDGLQVLPFKTTLFQAFLAPDLAAEIWVQPVSVTYHAPVGMDDRFYGWWGDMSFGGHLIATLALWRQGRVTTQYHPPLKVSEFATRKDLASACERLVRSAHPPQLSRQ